MLKIAICDSETKNAQVLFETAKSILSKSKLKCELSYHTDAAKLLDRLEEDVRAYDALFLNMREVASVKIAAALRKSNYKASIIFVNDETVGIENMLKFRPSALMTKRENQNQMLDILKIVYAEHKRLHPYLTVKNRDEIRQIDFDDIIYLESSQRIITVYTKKSVIKFYAKLNDVFSKLPREQFVRCHQSFAVNMSYIKNINKAEHYFKLSGGEIIEISKSLYSKVISEFEAYTKASD